MSLRLSFALLAGLFFANAALSADRDCSSCGDPKQPPYIYRFCGGCKTKYAAPYVHPDTPFGYYPSCWREWPGGATCPRPGCATNAPPMVPAIETPPPKRMNPDIEKLPPPRPAEPTLRAPAELRVSPARDRKSSVAAEPSPGQRQLTLGRRQ
jgi:hypothetical protein